MAGTTRVEAPVNGSTIAITVLCVEYLTGSMCRFYITRWRPWRLAGAGDYPAEAPRAFLLVPTASAVRRLMVPRS